MQFITEIRHWGPRNVEDSGTKLENNDGILDHDDDNKDDYGQNHLQHWSEQKKSKD